MIRDFLRSADGKGLSYYENKELSLYSTFGIGGPADFIILPENERMMIETLEELRKNKIRFKVFGNCSNLLFSDEGFNGAVILTRNMRGFELLENDVIEASSGASVISLSSFAAKKSLSGLEFACSIPATVGGAIYMNAGAYGSEFADILISSKYIDQCGNIHEIGLQEHDFSHRHSFYSEGNNIILSCKLQLSRKNQEEIYSKIGENKKKRLATQPISEKSAGSVFKRSGDIIPAKLIDEAGLKGLSVNDAEVSRMHAGFIINKGRATAADVKNLIELIKEKIYTLYKIELETEIMIIDK